MTIVPLTVLLAGGLLAAGPLTAQADSLAELARNRYREAVASYRGGDLSRARARMLEARAAWPAQWRYAYQVAALSARLSDTAATAAWIDSVAALGAGPDAGIDPDFTALASAPAVRAALARLERNREPFPASRIRFRLAGDDLFPEGIDVDSATGTFYLASIRHRSVLAVDSSGAARIWAAYPAAPLDAVLGVRVDSRRHRVWVTTRALPLMAGYRPGDGRRAAVLAFDLGSGRLLGHAGLPDDGPHTLGDLIVHPEGDVYLSDSESPVIYRARLRGRAIEVEPFVRSALFRSLQGPALDPAARTLFVADYSHGILAIDLVTRNVRLLDSPAGATTLGIDGLTWWNGGLIGIQNGLPPPRVVFLALDPSRTRVTRVDLLDRHLPEADEPTIGTRLGGRFLYVANSLWSRYDDEGRFRPGATAQPPVILELLLPVRR